MEAHLNTQEPCQLRVPFLSSTCALRGVSAVSARTVPCPPYSGLRVPPAKLCVFNDLEYRCMCGIVGAIADRDVVPVLIEGLKRLEYRGYDSAGIAVLDGADVRRVRRTGRVSEMESAAQS